MRSRLILASLLAALSLSAPALALPYSSLAASSASDMSPFLAPESGLPSDPVSATIFAAARLLNDQGIDDLKHKLQGHAESSFTRAIAMAPRAWALYANRAAAYAQRKNYSAAVKDIATALQLSPDNLTLLARRSTLLVMIKQYDRAKADLDRAVDIAPRDAGLLAQRAMLHLYLDNRPEAQADLDLARSIDPDQADVRRVSDMLASAGAAAKRCQTPLLSESGCGLAMISPNPSVSQRLRDVTEANLAMQKAEQAAAQAK
ncbi:MAG: hypothetical protein JWM33_2341 [Caulobacteraceae bacterium]|nr:hypothetical protein [Caulobacteraceae bacterium]